MRLSRSRTWLTFESVSFGGLSILGVVLYFVG